MASRTAKSAAGVVLAALLTAGPAPSDELAPVRLDDLVKEAVERNAQILASRAMLEMARAKAPQARALPDPMLQVEVQNIGLSGLTIGEMDMSMAGIGVSQTIPYPGKRALREQVARKEAEEAEVMVRATERSVIRRLKVAYYDLALIHESLDVVATTRAVMQEFEKTAQARYSVGEGIQQDVLKAQVELSMLTQREMALEQKREAAAATINSLLDRAPDAGLGRPEPLVPPRAVPALTELNGMALEHSPEVQARSRAVERGEAQVALMKKDYRPDFTVSAGWRSRGGLDDLYQVMVDVELPWQRMRRRAGVEEALHFTTAVRQERRATEQAVLAEVRDLATMAEQARRQVELFRTAVVPQSAFSLESAKAGYAVGKVDFLMVLDGVRTLLSNELMVQEQLADYHKAVARLEEVAGAEVEQ